MAEYRLTRLGALAALATVTGGELVGLENPPGHPGGLDSPHRTSPQPLLHADPRDGGRDGDTAGERIERRLAGAFPVLDR